MTILLKEVLITDSNSKHHNQVKDIFIDNGVIEKIDTSITANANVVLHQPNTIVSTGWVDIFSNFNDPGFEHKETLETGANTAIAGGFTTLFTLPNTKPTICTQSQVSYIVEKSKTLPVHIFPLGAISKKAEGNELAEMYDMKNSGAIAFSDGLNAVQSASLFTKALQYVKAFNGILIQMPVDNGLSKLGLMNEGITSTQLGLPGIPAFAETLMIKRDIELLKYTQSKLHITGVSTIESVELIDEAKKQGLQISCSVAPYHLFFCDEDLVTYDTNLKVNPPLRSKSDMLALQQALLDGKIDCIASHHFPQHSDDKVCEFEYAKNGMIGLQTLFAVINDILPQLSTTNLVNILSKNASNIFGLPANTIEEGATASLTLFNRNQTTTLTNENNKSKSANTAFLNKQLKGKVIGVVNKGKLFLNEYAK